MEVTDYQPGVYHYARGNATGAYQPSKVEHFTREVAYTPDNNVLVVFDRVRSSDPGYKKVWLLHGVSEPRFINSGREMTLDTVAPLTATQTFLVTRTARDYCECIRSCRPSAKL